LPLLFISRIGAGLAGATIGTAHAYIADVTPPEKRTGGMALVGAAFGIGFTFGPLLGALALVNQPPDSPTVSYWPGVWAAGLSFAAFILALFRLPESRQPGGPARERKLSAENLRAVLVTPLVPLLILAFFAATLAFSQFESTLSLVLKDVFNVPDRQTYLIFGYVGFMLILAQGLLVRRLAKRIADQHLARTGVLLMLVGIALGLVALATASLPALLAIMPILIGGFALMTPSLQSMVSKRTPADRQGAVLGVNQSASSLARIIGQTVGIWFLKASVFLPYVVTGLLMAAVFLLLQFRVLGAVAAESEAAAVPDPETAPTQPQSA
jgi:MFS family permease